MLRGLLRIVQANKLTLERLTGCASSAETHDDVVIVLCSNFAAVA